VGLLIDVLGTRAPSRYSLDQRQRLSGFTQTSVSVVPPLVDCLADLSDLRRFGVALARDDRFVLDQSSAATLVDRLFRQASLEAVGASVRRDTGQGREDARVRAFRQFVRLHRRHVRRLTLGDGEPGWEENAESARAKAPAGGIGVAAAVRMLPLELREALLIVVLAGFTHREAASALDISLATLIARLTKARERVAALTHSPAAAGARPTAVPHLRVVK
jgi:RNA polymerase sigma-70 factor, ECF subfamily